MAEKYGGKVLKNIKFKTYDELNEKLSITYPGDKICGDNKNIQLYAAFDDWYLEKVIVIGESGEFEQIFSLTYNEFIYED